MTAKLPNTRTSLHKRFWAVLLLGAGIILLAMRPGVFSGRAVSEDALTYASQDGSKPGTIGPRSSEFLRIAALNRSLPSASDRIVPAEPLSVLSDAAGVSGLSAIDCLAAAVYYEAANEPLVGQRAVAQVVLNRVRHPAYPNTVCGVVFQGAERATGCQFTFTCDGSLRRTPSSAGWKRAQSVAVAALTGYVEPSVGHATHYHTIYVRPYWADSLVKLNDIASHIFYLKSGSQGLPAAFSQRYAGGEEFPIAAISSLSTHALSAPSLQAYVAEQATSGIELTGITPTTISGLERSNASVPATDSLLSAKLNGSSLIERRSQLLLPETQLKDRSVSPQRLLETSPSTD